MNKQFPNEDIKVFFLLALDDSIPEPEAPDAEDLAAWDKLAGWGDKGASLADPDLDPEAEFSGSKGKDTIFGVETEDDLEEGDDGKDANMVLKPGFVVYERDFLAGTADKVIGRLIDELKGE